MPARQRNVRPRKLDLAAYNGAFLKFVPWSSTDLECAFTVNSSGMCGMLMNLFVTSRREHGTLTNQAAPRGRP
jgi:hypothetical protein